MDKDNEFVVWRLAETSHEWLEWVKIGSCKSLKEAQELGKERGGCWGIRHNTDPKPSYISDDGRWIGV